MKETNIRTVRSVALSFLYQDIITNTQQPPLAYHPFFNSVMAVFPGKNKPFNMLRMKIDLKN